jgi:outer membrane receptor protein involved in Fe transport
VPVVAASQEISFVHSLEVQASFRRDEYTTVSVPPTTQLVLETPNSPIPPFSRDTSKTASNDFTFGVGYKPVEDVALRASFGTGFLPPSLAQISYQKFEPGFYFLTDPKRGNVLAPTLIQLAYGGSSAVRPEQSKSFSAGLIYTPNFVPRLRVSADYTRIKKTDEITTLSVQQILNLEDTFPGRVARGPNLPGDPVGYAGIITEIDGTLFNIAASKVEAWDFQVEYAQDLKKWGELQLYGVATLQSALENKTISTSPVIDRVGYSDGPLKWRGNAGFVWKVGAWTTSLNTQWYDDYLVYSSNDDSLSQETLSHAQGAKRISSQIYTDVSTRYTFRDGSLHGMWISVGVRNVFDTSPPILATTDSRGGYSTYGDPRGRTYVLSLQKSF